MGAVPTMLIALPEVRAESGPTTSQPWTRWIATQLSRMVEMTSWTPRSAFRRPGSAPQMPPASAADARQTGTRRGAGRSKALPATAAASAPQMSCPSAPMLKTPTVNGIATERPVRTRTLPFTALSPSAAALPNAPSKRCANPSAAFLPEARMATNDTARAMATATTAPHNGSRDGANHRARGLRGMIAVAEHEPPEHLVARGRIRLSRDASLEEDGDAVADRAQLVEVGGDDDHRRACPRRRAQRVVQAARRRQVEPARRLCGDDELRRGSALELARGDELLLVAAREVACPRERIRRAHVEGADQLRRLASPAGAIDERTARMGRIAMPSQREVLLAGERQAESAPARVVGHMDHSAAACGERRPRPTFLAVQAEHTGRGAKPAERFDELGLPVALDSGHPEDLAARHRQGRAPARPAKAASRSRPAAAPRPRASRQARRPRGAAPRGRRPPIPPSARARHRGLRTGGAPARAPRSPRRGAAARAGSAGGRLRCRHRWRRAGRRAAPRIRTTGPCRNPAGTGRRRCSPGWISPRRSRRRARGPLLPRRRERRPPPPRRPRSAW